MEIGMLDYVYINGEHELFCQLFHIFTFVIMIMFIIYGSCPFCNIKFNISAINLMIILTYTVYLFLILLNLLNVNINFLTTICDHKQIW